MIGNPSREPVPLSLPLAVQLHGNRSQEDRKQLGLWLIQCKDACLHAGESWLEWLERETGIPERTAQRFMEEAQEKRQEKSTTRQLADTGRSDSEIEDGGPVVTVFSTEHGTHRIAPERARASRRPASRPRCRTLSRREMVRSAALTTRRHPGASQKTNIPTARPLDSDRRTGEYYHCPSYPSDAAKRLPHERRRRLTHNRMDVRQASGRYFGRRQCQAGLQVVSYGRAGRRQDRRLGSSSRRVRQRLPGTSKQPTRFAACLWRAVRKQEADTGATNEERRRGLHFVLSPRDGSGT